MGIYKLWGMTRIESSILLWFGTVMGCLSWAVYIFLNFNTAIRPSLPVLNYCQFAGDGAVGFGESREALHLPLSFRVVGFYNAEQLDSIRQNIGAAVQHLNEVSEGVLTYSATAPRHIVQSLELREMYQAFAKTPNAYDAFVAATASLDTLTVYITTSSSTEAGKLLGFTPELPTDDDNLERMRRDTARAKLFGHVFVASDGLTAGTLAHEVYHWLGLAHPWEISEDDRRVLGIDAPDVLDANLMSYSDRQRSLTSQQLASAHHYAQTYRMRYVR